MSKGTKRLVPAAVLAAAMLLLAATAASGAPNRDCDDPKWADHPFCQTTTTTATTEAPGGEPSCYERVREMGASGWAYDPVTEDETQWDGSAYVQTGIPACIDIDQPGHTGQVTWEVSWGGGTTARPIKGIKLVFERGVHGTTYAEHESDLATCDVTSGTEDCPWTVTIDPGGLEPLVLVAMPRHGDKWTTPPTFTVTPAGP